MSKPPRIPLDSQLGFFKVSFVTLWTSFEAAFSSSAKCVHLSLSVSLVPFCSPLHIGDKVSLMTNSNIIYIRDCNYRKRIKSHAQSGPAFSLCASSNVPPHVEEKKPRQHSFTPSAISSDTDWALRQHQLLKCEFWNCSESWWGLHGLLFLRKLRCIFCDGHAPAANPIHFDWIGSQELQLN